MAKVEFIKSLSNNRVYSMSDTRESLITLTAVDDPKFYFTILRNQYDSIASGKNTQFAMADAVIQQTATVVKPAHVPGAGTKMERAIDIYKAMPGASRQQLISAFVDQLGMTPAGASTYAYNVKKAVNV